MALKRSDIKCLAKRENAGISGKTYDRSKECSRKLALCNFFGKYYVAQVFNEIGKIV